MSSRPVATVFGGTRIGNRELFLPENSLYKFLEILLAHGVTNIDTAQSYGNSQDTIGQVKAGESFTIDTKWSPPSFGKDVPPWATTDFIINSAQESIQKLGVKQVDVFYLHKPDPKTSIAETLSAVNHVYKRGLFRRFGLSGFPATEVEAVYNHCLDNGYPIPRVYQGSYNALSRHKEAVLLSTLRKLNMSFYAYSPSAGGFLGKTVEQVGQMAANMATVSATCKLYVGDPRFLEILKRWNQVALSEGVSASEMAYRWVTHHSALSREHNDAIILNASSLEQLEETLSGLEKGPLSARAASEIHHIWKDVKNWW